MKLEKAVEIETAYLERGEPVEQHEHTEAEKLGLEALKRCKYISEHTTRWADVLLPGETEGVRKC